MFVNAPLDEVTAQVDALGLTLVQLHGEEGPAYCEEVRRRTGAQIIKAARVGGAADLQAVEPFRTDFHLLDTHHENLRGGTGETLGLGADRAAQLARPADHERRPDAGERGRGDPCGPSVRRRHRERHGVRARAQGSGEARRVRRRGGRRHPRYAEAAEAEAAERRRRRRQPRRPRGAAAAQAEAAAAETEEPVS